MFICHSFHHTSKKGFTRAFRTWKMSNLKRNCLYDSQAFEEHRRTHKITAEDTVTHPIEQWLVTLSTHGRIPYRRFESEEWQNHIRAVVFGAHNHRGGLEHFLSEYKKYCARRRVRGNTSESSCKVQQVSILTGIFNSSGNYK